MIKNWLLRGDAHRRFDWVNISKISGYDPEETAIILLGDAGIDFNLDASDDVLKAKLCETGYTFYLVRGNHEQRPLLVPGVRKVWDETVKEFVYVNDSYPNIRYLIDGTIYQFGPYSALVIGGAYSVDKYYRIARAGLTPESSPLELAQKAGWFADEQLTQEEMDKIIAKSALKSVDFLLTHTCPYSWRPTDLFLLMVDQTTVDNTMEKWLDIIRNVVDWKIWCFGHMHADRVERPHVEQFYHDIQSLDQIYNRWYGERTFANGEAPFLDKSPNFREPDNPYYKESQKCHYSC